MSGTHTLQELGFDVDVENSCTQKTQRTYTSAEKEVIDLLYEPATRSELSRKLGLPINEPNQRLSAMEIKGLVKERGGRAWLAG